MRYRYRFATVIASMLLTLPAGAQNGVPPPPQLNLPPPVAPSLPPVNAPASSGDIHTDASRRTLGGHLFMAPASIESAFVQTIFDVRTSARHESVSDVPFGNVTTDLKTLGVRETFLFDVAVNDVWGLGVGAFGQFNTGTNPRSLAIAGANYAYGALVNGALRIARIESSGTQITLRAQFFGAQGGQRLTLVPFLRSVRNMPAQTVAALITNFGELVQVPTSWYGGAAAITLAQALSPVFGLQASFRLDLQRFHQAPFVPGQGRVDIDSTGWLPSVGVAFGITPPNFPVAFLAEYRTAAQNFNDPTSRAHHLVGIGAYYTARLDLQLGLNVSGEFGLPEIPGIDADGNLAASKRGNAISGQFVMRYYW